MARQFLEKTFTPSVKAAQARMGASGLYDRSLAQDAPRADRIGDVEAAFIEARDGFYQATVSESGWPYVQFRGGPAGFLKVLDGKRIAYADYRGNRQYISVGNLDADDRVALILMDYPNRRRLKVLGHVRMVSIDEDPDLVASLHVPGYKARPERVVIIEVAALDWNCPQHIPIRLTLEELETQLDPIRAELERLQSENTALRTALAEHETQSPA